MVILPDGFSLERCSVIHEKNRREIVLLRGRGCSWRRCRFCDYHLDFDPSDELNFALNSQQLSKVTGIYKKLEIINSGSFPDLDPITLDKIKEVCELRGITQLHFECHWIHRDMIAPLKKQFEGVTIKVKTGVETFDALFRECYLDKGIDTGDPAEIAAYFDECCLLMGLPGQTEESMLRDIDIGLRHFERVCINIMQENGMPVRPDPAVIQTFNEKIYPVYRDDFRVDILLNNTDFGVGGTEINAQ